MTQFAHVCRIFPVLLFVGQSLSSSPSATFCRVCDTHDLGVGDDCYQTSHRKHDVCRGNCLTRFTHTSSGLRIQKSCVSDSICISEWWQDSSRRPECQADYVGQDGASLQGYSTSCSVCCSAVRDGNIYCNDDIYPAQTSLSEYLDYSRPPMQTSIITKAPAILPKETSPTPSYLSNKYPEPMVCADCTYIDQNDLSSCNRHKMCAGDKPLCMTSFYDDGRDNLTMVKRCASVSECSTLWWDQTHPNPDCMGDSDHDPYSWIGGKSGQCHYCCHTPRGQELSWCNKAMWPTKPSNTIDMLDYAATILTWKTNPTTYLPTATTSKQSSSSTSTSSSSSSSSSSSWQSTASQQTIIPHSTQPPTTFSPFTQSSTLSSVIPTSPSTSTTEPVSTTNNAMPSTSTLILKSSSTQALIQSSPRPSTDTQSSTSESLTSQSTESYTHTPQTSQSPSKPSIQAATATSETISSTMNTSTNNTTQTIKVTTTMQTNSPQTAYAALSTPLTFSNQSTTSTASDYITTNKQTPEPPTTLSTETWPADTTNTILSADTSLPSTSSSPVSPKQATALQTTITSSIPAHQCEVCDETSGQSCSNARVESCGADQPYCKNTILFGSDTNANTFKVRKRCASTQSCMSSNINNQLCYGDINDPGMLGSGASCNFCCNDTSSSVCNTNPRPDKVLSFLPKQPTVSLRSCIQCGDEAKGQPCGPVDLLLGTSMPCAPGFNFCMNDMLEHQDGSRSIYKRCVDQSECFNKWFKESSDDSECNNYDPHTPPSTNLECHFCCDKDGCNRKTKPDLDLLWSPYNR